MSRRFLTRAFDLILYSSLSVALLPDYRDGGARRRRPNRTLRIGALLLLLERLSVVISCDIVAIVVGLLTDICECVLEECSSKQGEFGLGGGLLQALWSRAHHSRDLFALPQYLPQ